MEYYILKLYQSEKAKNSDVEQGFNCFESQTKRQIIICLVTMFLGCIEMLVSILILPKKSLYWIGLFIGIISLAILMRIDNADQKKHMDMYIDTYSKKIDILYNLLSVKFKIDSREKIEELINIYQIYIDERNKKEKARNGIILTIFSAFAGVLSISFVNMDIIGINFYNWLYIATILLIFVLGAGIWIYSFNLLGSLKKKYEMMIKDLRDLQLLKY